MNHQNNSGPAAEAGQLGFAISRLPSAAHGQLPLTFAVTGAAALVGPAAATAEGGMGGTYLRTVGQTGTAALTVSAPQCAPATVEFTVTKKECAVWN